MGDENLYKTVRVAEGHDYKRVDIEHDTTYQEQPEELRHPCRICLQYYDVGCMQCSRESSDGICKICAAEYLEEYRKLPEGKAAAKKYSQSPKGKVARKKAQKRFHEVNPSYHKDYQREWMSRFRLKQKLLKMIHKDLYADLWERGLLHPHRP